MEILCLMGLFPEVYEAEIIKNSVSGVQNAANKLQWAIVDGLMQQEQANVHILNSMYIGSYPKRYKKVRVPSFPFCVDGIPCGYNAGFYNLPVIKVADRYIKSRKRIGEWAIQNTDEEKVVIAYAMTSPMVELLQYIKSQYPAIKCILIVPDLPEYMNMAKKTWLFNAVKRVHIAHMRRCLRSIDGYVFLTEYMKDWFSTPVEYTVIEGIYKERSVLLPQMSSKEKVVLYTGGMQEEYGVLHLVESFQKTAAYEWTLELIGDGSLMPILQTISKKDKRIILRGLLPNSQVIERQRQVSILVNPRMGNQTFTKYSFPSKTIEYMASGTPMMGYRLSGIPDEYYDYIYEISASENGLYDGLKMMMQMSEQQRSEMGLRASEFIRREKNSKVQCRKIIDLMNRLP